MAKLWNSIDTWHIAEQSRVRRVRAGRGCRTRARGRADHRRIRWYVYCTSVCSQTFLLKISPIDVSIVSSINIKSTRIIVTLNTYLLILRIPSWLKKSELSISMERCPSATRTHIWGMRAADHFSFESWNYSKVRSESTAAVTCGPGSQRGRTSLASRSLQRFNSVLH